MGEDLGCCGGLGEVLGGAEGWSPLGDAPGWTWVLLRLGGVTSPGELLRQPGASTQPRKRGINI